MPDHVEDAEPLYRRVHPTFVRPDGSLSSQAFSGEEMSVDRAHYSSVEESLLAYDGYGLAELVTRAARELNQEVRAAKLLLNPAHALVVGKKSKGVARRLAAVARWVKNIPPQL